jgi:hypothetical protein
VERKVLKGVLQDVCVILRHEVPGLNDVIILEQGDIKGDVVLRTAEVVFVGVEVYVKAVSVIDAGDSELEDLHFLEEVRHEFGGLIGKHDVVVLSGSY